MSRFRVVAAIVVLSTTLAAQSLTLNGQSGAIDLYLGGIAVFSLNGPPGAPTLWCFDVSPGPVDVAGLSIPIGLTPGVIELVGGAPMPAGGQLGLVTGLPFAPALEGVTLYSVAAFADGSPPAGFSISDGIALTFRILRAQAAPVASTLVNCPRLLDGSPNRDALGNLLPGFTFAWSVSASPPGASYGIANSTQEFATFSAATPGLYQITLHVSAPDPSGFTNNPLPSIDLVFPLQIDSVTLTSPIVEDFNDVTQLAAQSGEFKWADPAGFAQLQYPIDLVGDGSDGPMVVSGTLPVLFDTDQQIMVGGQLVSRKGVWNFSSFTVNAGAFARFHGPWPAHVRCNGAVTINGAVRVDAGMINPAGLGTNPAFEAGPATGAFDNGGAIGSPIVVGGKGNCGGGDGGRASANDVNPAPSAYCPPVAALHTYFGDVGYGPTVNGLPNASPADPSYAGGGGGRSGFFPGTFFGEQGGYGGAGGTAATQGEIGQPRVPATCAPFAVPLCPVPGGAPLPLAQSHAVTAAFIPPVSAPSAGSGGGGGGDKLQTVVPPSFDEQGGGGGGGGGALRISSLGAISFGAAAVVSANGAAGAAGATLAGSGGSGSGGEIWIQTFQGITTPATTTMQVFGQARFGGAAGVGCSLQAAGGGGQGLIQLEAGSGTPNLNFAFSAGAVVSTPPFAFAAAVSGDLVSNFYDAGQPHPDYTSVVEISTLGNAAGATLTITYEGAMPGPGGAPDLSTLKALQSGAPIDAAAVPTALDGYRFIRFRAHATYPAPPATSPTAILPSIDSITINYVIGCQ